MKKQLNAAVLMAGLLLAVPAMAQDAGTLDDFEPGKWVITSERILGTIITTDPDEPRAVQVDKTIEYADSSAYITLLPENIFVIQGFESGDLTGRLLSKTFGTWTWDGYFVELEESGSGNAYTAIVSGNTLVINSREIEYSPHLHTDVARSLTFERDEILPAPVQAEAPQPGKPQG